MAIPKIWSKGTPEWLKLNSSAAHCSKQLPRGLNDCAGELKDSDDNYEALRISVMCKALQDRGRLHQFHGSAEEQHQYGQSAHDAPAQHRFLETGQC
jgi:hypothetical protein